MGNMLKKNSKVLASDEIIKVNAFSYEDYKKEILKKKIKFSKKAYHPNS